ncbi:MAG: MogA/MoaB family molybdenum cofactor biosynthesis protein [Halothermotrichaceae bacterium]
MIKAAILSINGRQEPETSEYGQIVKDMIKEIDGKEVYYNAVADEFGKIQEELFNLTEKGTADIIFTIGGTGFKKKDITPEATMAVIEKETPGIAELMRRKMSMVVPEAILLRGRAGIRKSTLIINLPGDTTTIKECLKALLPVIPRGVEVLKQIPTRHKLLKLWDQG